MFLTRSSFGLACWNQQFLHMSIIGKNMKNSKFCFVALRKPLFCLLAVCMALFVCVWVSVSPLPRISTAEDINTTEVLQKIQLDFLCPLPEEDYETLRHLEIIIHNANFRINAARKEGVESFEHIINDGTLREALDLSKKIISSIDSRIVLPDIFLSYSYHGSNTFQECFLAHFENLREIAHLNNRLLGTASSILLNSFRIHESQSDVDSMLQSLLLLETLCNSIQINSLYSCIRSSTIYNTIILMYRPLETYPMESQSALKAMLERVKIKLNLMVYGLVYNARNETLLAVPLLLQLGHKEHVEELLELVAFYDEIIENMPAFFDLGQGTIYNLNVSEIDLEEGSLMSLVRLWKIEVQIYRDRYADWFQQTCLLLSDEP